MFKKLYKRNEFLVILLGLISIGVLTILSKILPKSQQSNSLASKSPPLSAPQDFISSKKRIKTSTDKGESEITLQIYTEVGLNGTLSLELVEVPKGTFIMGSPSDEVGHLSSEEPLRQVKFKKSFYMSRSPITQEQWETVMGYNPSTFKGQNLPVETVSWKEAQKFCNELSKQTGREYRLPSEAEWEYACRAGRSTPFYFGDDISPTQANYDTHYSYKSKQSDGKYEGQTTPVGVENFPANQFGLEDMHGNVWEWCSDSWHDNYDRTPTDGTPYTSGVNEQAVIRGGAWHSFPSRCRSAAREEMWKKVKSNRIGFRVVCVNSL
ncbi:formylglycine-generating enzyme family protein [Planktothrix mougeotii]|uniref:Formylglycine-generating enzyme family protein n=1 Tax=Planktothrix mougeotii LEGE 06226 TaxID=1828728 RepID=A0ABR9U9M2_9CYAN|nr:formylglycine-generating enzyme family protein [Planktothrix mougeotii]MBE9143136.1 formylglycine-generating enzyme family protein [Planktothrix mougeotii LEGE 06226]